MIREVNRACEKLNETLGLSLSLPAPGKKALRAAARCNLAGGAALAAAGVLFSSKCCVLLGSIGIASGAVLQKEEKKKGS